MKCWTINIWGLNFLANNKLSVLEQKLDDLEKNNYDSIIIFCQGEINFFSFGNYKLILERILTNAKTKQIKIDIVLGSDPYQYKDTETFSIFEKYQIEPQIHWWPTFFISKCVNRVFNRHVRNPNTNIFIENLNDIDYKFHFIFMNNKYRRHRARLLDCFAEFDLLRYGAYSWHNIYEQNISYSFKYYDGSSKTLDEQFATTEKDQFSLPKEYYQSFVQVVTESTTTYTFITEKTIIPLLIGKPFLISGTVGIHTFLKDLGFELYDELFDYSFDNINDMDKRIDAICDNIKTITKLSLEECKNLNNKIQNKVNHNRKRAIEIAYEQLYAPDLVKDVIAQYKNTGILLDTQIVKIYNNLQKNKHVTNLFK